MNRFQHVHFLYFQVSYSSQQADIDFEKIWQQRQQYMIKSSVVYAMSLISVILCFPLVRFRKKLAFKVGRSSFNPSYDIGCYTLFIFLKDLTGSVVAVVVLLVVDVYLVIVSDSRSMEIDDSVSASIHCMLLRLFLVLDGLRNSIICKVILSQGKLTYNLTKLASISKNKKLMA